MSSTVMSAGAMRARFFTALVCTVLATVPLTPTAVAQDYAAIVAATDCSDADRTTDQRRKPAQLLAFIGVKTGMRVLEMGAGGGYAAELLARAVGQTGKVWAHETEAPSERAKATFDTRAGKPVMANVARLATTYGDPVPADVRDLDLITFLFSYHDTTFMPVDRAVMNKKLLAALKPGGVLLIADHSGKAGDGASVGKSLHRIEESTLRQEIEAAGFKFVAASNLLRNPNDPRDKRVFQPEQPVDEFILKFERPR